jgi:peroxiredoxin
MKDSFKISCLLVVLLILLPHLAHGQGYIISAKIKGAENQDAQFAYYQGDKQYIVSNSKFDKNGQLTLAGEQKLPSGIYFIVVGKLGFFDILIRDEQEFSLKSDTSDLVGLMKIKGSKDNEIFFNYQKEVIEKKKEIANYETRIKESDKKQDSIAIYKKKVEKVTKELEELVNKTRKEHPDSYLAKLLSAMSEPNVDNFKFDDKDLLRTPFFHNMVRLFIKKNIEKNAEYINYQTQKLLSSVRHEEANYQYIANYLLNFYNTFYKIGMNEVFVFIADNYFLPDKATWFNQQQRDEIQKRRDYFAQSLPGKPAQDLTLESTTGEFFSLHQMESNLTLLYFWSADCGHCTESTEILKSYYEQLKAKNIHIFAVNIDKDKTKWLKKVEENEIEWLNCYDPEGESGFREKYYVFGSPLLYLINKDKKIVSRWNGEDEIEKLCKELTVK